MIDLIELKEDFDSLWNRVDELTGQFDLYDVQYYLTQAIDYLSERIENDEEDDWTDPADFEIVDDEYLDEGEIL